MMKKSNIRLALKASTVLIILLIGIFLLCSCASNTSSADSAETVTEQKFTPLSDTEPSETLSSSSGTVTDTTTTVLSTVSKTTVTASSGRTTEQFATTSAKPSTAAPSTAEPTASTSSRQSRPRVSDRIDKIISRINGKNDETEDAGIAVPADVTLPSSTQAPKLDFTGCAFLGNSRVLSVKNYGFCKEVYGKVSLTVESVFTEKSEGSSVPIIDELKGKDYKNIFIMFGDNETGWGSMDAFRKDYVKVINAVRERVPGAKIYLISILPISKEASDKNEYGYSKRSIDSCNKIIQDIAKQEGITYIDAGSTIADKNGYLPAEASTDGSHLGKEYTRKWLEVCAKYV